MDRAVLVVPVAWLEKVKLAELTEMAGTAGVAALTVSARPNVALPLEFVAVIVYVACAAVAVGVPEIRPLVVLSDNPLGNTGLTE
jgi:hypothetical protein